MSHVNTNEWLADTSRTLPNEDEPLVSPIPSRENMSLHRHFSRNSIPSHQAAVSSVDALQVPPPISLLHVPPELIIRIVLHLSPHDIISCGRTCRMLHDICSCPHLRYLVQMERCAVSDDMRPGLGYLERLRILEDREKSWATLDFRRSIQVLAPFNSTSTYDFTGGTLLFGTRPSHAADQSTVGYSYISLPSLSDSQDHKLEWKGFSLETDVLDFALAAHEADLIAVLTATADAHRPSENMTLEMRLLSPSTGQPHPLAEQPIIFIATKSLPLGMFGIHIEIIGDFLIYLITFEEWVKDQDIFSLVRWKRGEVHSLRSSEWEAYTYFSFVSQDTLVFPNLDHNTLDVSKIVIDSDDTPRLVPLCALHLPPVTRDAVLHNLYCRAEPNPSSLGPASSSSLSDRPFRDKAEDAIIFFDTFYGHPSGSAWPTFIVHRSALLSVAHRAGPPFCSTPDGTTRGVAHVPWSAWGPAATRWFKGERVGVGWISRTAGQRTVTLGDSMPTPVIVRDFNPYAVRAACAAASASGKSQQGNWGMQLPDGNRMTLNVMESVLSAGRIFKEDVRSSLPYVEIVTQNKYHYEGVMIDEQRILGFNGNRKNAAGTWSFDVHVLG